MITIQGELYSSKNSRTIHKAGNRRFVAKSKPAKAQETTLALQLASVRTFFLNDLQEKGSHFPIRLAFKIYRRTHGRFDYVNIIQGLLDAMVKARLLPDDDADHVIPMFKQYEVDPKNPRTEITIIF